MTNSGIDISGIIKIDSNQLPAGVSATLSDIGVITTTGQPFSVTIYKNETAGAIGGKIGTKVLSKLANLSWQDVLAFSIVAKTLHSDPFNGRPAYYAGKRVLDELSLLMIADEIAASAGAKSWNSVMVAKQASDPIKQDDAVQVDSPFNPNSIYYDPKKPVFTYDPEKGYIVYKSGEIVWTKTGGVYYDAENGQAVSYSPDKVRFSSGNVLDLVTLKLTKANGGTETVSNELGPFKKLLRSLLTDTKTQLAVLGGLFLLIILKKKRNEK